MSEATASVPVRQRRCPFLGGEMCIESYVALRMLKEARDMMYADLKAEGVELINPCGHYTLKDLWNARKRPAG